MKIFFAGLLLLLSSTAIAGTVNDSEALADLKAVRIICDVNVGESKLLLRRLELIDETYSQLLDAGVRPTFVVAFRGGASHYVTGGDKYVGAENRATKKEIQGWINQFDQHGFRLEQCAIAAKARNVNPADLLPAVHLVQNGYISIVAYQSRGYALLPMD